MTAMTATTEAVTVADLLPYPRDATVQIVDGTIYLSRAGGFAEADLTALPDDHRRHELVDGVIVVSPAPRRLHQRAVTTLAKILATASPRRLEVLVAPFEVDAGARSQVQPDLLVLPRDEPDEPVTSPLLVVEVLSPSNRGYDLVTKRNLYERAGVPGYWIVDPDEPSVTVLQLIDGGYAESVTVTGSGVVAVDEPFTVTFRPVDLVE